MITISEDPLQVWINRLHQFGLKLMDEDLIINAGMSNHPNAIEAEGIGYESLPKEAIFLRGAAQYRSSLRNGQRMMVLYLTGAARRIRRANRPASKP